MALNKRDQLLDMAAELFFKHGCHTTGIDKLLAEAGVAKMTLYTHFKSKEDLILAATERLHDRALAQYRGILGNPSLTARERLRALFDHVDQILPELDGCPFQSVTVEFSDPQHPIHLMAARHVLEVQACLQEALQTAGAAVPERLARQLMLLCEGAKMLTRMTGQRHYLTDARAAAEELVERALS